jgi:hypothetical protein
MNGIVKDMGAGLSRRMELWGRLCRGFVLMAAVASVLFAATDARAGCGAYPGLALKGGVRPASFVLGVGLMTAGDSDFPREDASIVGLWRVKVLSRGNQAAGIPDGVELDQGYSVWHNDGTEILNSGRDPMTGSFCLGAWKQTGRFSYKLNHYAMNWTGVTVDAKGNVKLNPATQQPLNTLIGSSNIREDVTLDPGKNLFQGTFTLENFDQNGKTLVRLTGEIIGTRLTENSPNYVQ